MLELTPKYKNGIIKLAVLLVLLCFFIAFFKWYPVSEPAFVVNEDLQCKIDNKKLIEEELKAKKVYKYYINSINDFQGYQLGLSTYEIDSLLAFRKKGKLIYDTEQFQKITGVRQKLLDSIAPFLVFAKPRKAVYKPVSHRAKSKDINKASYFELKNLGIPNKIANRILNYRNSIGGYKSMQELQKVYDIEQSHLDILNKKFFVKN